MDRGPTPSGPHEQHEPSARAGHSRSPVPSPREEFTITERSIADLLGTLSSATGPDEGERGRMRSRIVAGLGQHTPTHSRRRRADATRPSSSVRGRFAIAAVAALALLFSLTGMSLLLSRDALPGDALYGIKRTAEAASLGLTFGDEPKALKHLEFAAARVTEIETLTQRYPAAADAPVGGYLTALTDLDTDAGAGARQLVDLGTRSDPRLLEALRTWSVQQSNRLGAVDAKLPRAARDRLGGTSTLLGRITERADTLLGRSHCYEITSGAADDVGALPASGVCHTRASATTVNPPAGRQRPSGTTGQHTPSGVPGVPLPPGGPVPTRPLPPVPVPPPGAMTPAPGLPQPWPVPGPGPTAPGRPPTLNVPLPLPQLTVPPPLPGLPAITIG
ncbi:hypothetical protein EV193_101449 [Herbihabitans rhizosphaerae]|uniref:DUF5667 domain-containing protein n=1 Tax=Herbihabitans rhizosphaerae TaxID=1872711 RepID=A0A4V2EUH3_9PSEU|nr:DUF5667 domain-containing protein [Herbihabitans rhizosphaerae]RZS44573.1 hypothetical protein EV193_101449 [Herbihabitans rhizosphaerae]